MGSYSPRGQEQPYSVTRAEKRIRPKSQQFLSPFPRLRVSPVRKRPIPQTSERGPPCTSSSHMTEGFTVNPSTSHVGAFHLGASFRLCRTYASLYDRQASCHMRRSRN